VIAELLLYLRGRSDRIARRSGLLKDAVGLWSRSRRRKREWGLHYSRCHAFIEARCGNAARYRRIAILGSGLCEDVPLAWLAERCETLLLVDIVHLDPVRARIAADAALAAKARFISRDLTGLLEFMDSAEAMPHPLPEPMADLLADPAIDLVISAMCLSQLPRAIGNNLARTRLSDDDQEAICACVVGQHLAALHTFSCDVILLSDTAYSEFGRDGSFLGKHDLLYGRTPPDPLQNWDWDVAPKGEVAGGASFRHHVAAWHWPRGKS
jgi:hypothetical protein